VTRFQFVADHQTRYGVKRLCAAIGVARSSFYYWRATEPARAARDAADALVANEITANPSCCQRMHPTLCVPKNTSVQFRRHVVRRWPESHPCYSSSPRLCHGVVTCGFADRLSRARTAA
jgi:hypothetical protein